MFIKAYDKEYSVNPSPLPDGKWAIFNAETGDEVSGNFRKTLKRMYQDKVKSMESLDSLVPFNSIPGLPEKYAQTRAVGWESTPTYTQSTDCGVCVGTIQLGTETTAPTPSFWDDSVSLGPIATKVRCKLKNTMNLSHVWGEVAPYIQGTSSQLQLVDDYDYYKWKIQLGTLDVPKEKENTMRIYSNANDFAIEQRNFILKKLDEAVSDARRSLTKAFHLYDDAAPRTVKEFVDRILAGKYMLPKNKMGEDLDEEESNRYDDFCDCYRTPGNAIIWRDPALKADQAGYDVAEEDLEAAKEAAEEVIMLGTLEEGRKALEDFRAKTFH